MSLQAGDSYQALREENEYLRKQLAQAEWSNQQLRGTEEQTVSGSEDEEEESGGECVMHFMFLSLCSCSTGLLNFQLLCYVHVSFCGLRHNNLTSVQHTMYYRF